METLESFSPNFGPENNYLLKNFLTVMETLESFFPNFGPENNYLLKKFSYRDGNS
jgi:hypothetical protein